MAIASPSQSNESGTGKRERNVKTRVKSACLSCFSRIHAFAVDGVVLINQASVTAASGFPFKITESGSYKLSGSLVVPAGTDGIDIQANDVTLDLNGFSISVPIVCEGTNCGTPLSRAVSGVSALVFGTTIRNGHVRVQSGSQAL